MLNREADRISRSSPVNSAYLKEKKYYISFILNDDYPRVEQTVKLEGIWNKNIAHGIGVHRGNESPSTPKDQFFRLFFSNLIRLISLLSFILIVYFPLTSGTGLHSQRAGYTMSPKVCTQPGTAACTAHPAPISAHQCWTQGWMLPG